MAGNEQIERKLDMIASILRIAFDDEIAEARKAIREDKGKAAILDGSSDWVGAGKLVKAAGKKGNKGESTIRGYVAELIERGLLEKRGGGPSTEYRSTGVV